jgi:hypothetical protein
MDEVFELQGKGASSFLNFQRLLPPGHELVGFEDENGNFFSVEQLKAIEWQEQHQMDIQAQTKVPDSMQALLGQISNEIAKPKFIRQVRKCYHFGDTFIAVANDDTVWHLKRHDNGVDCKWKQLKDAMTPPLPQGEV